MFGILLSCISQLWDVFRELIASTSNNQIPSSSTSDSVASTSNSLTPSNSVMYSEDPSSSQTSSSDSLSNSSRTNYDVFLSFYGKDTRYKFTSHLYDKLVSYGIRTFMDNPELRTGDVITDALIQAIKDSKIYVVVFSENYAYSPWCLDELVEIYKYYETMERSVIGVYYNIDPSVVRHQKVSFMEAFEKHETRFAAELDKVKKWRLTLRNVAGFSGKHISAERSEADVIKEIVGRILLEINPKTLHVAKYPVGLESHVNGITPLLSSDTQGMIKFGIYGMGGVGKTTLAKAIYNELLLGSFEGNCFLANVRDVSGRPNGLESLQQQLIDDILKSKNLFTVNNVDEGFNFIEDRICPRKVLVVVDDLDHHKQFDYLVRQFGSGSVVIITTRDEELLDILEVESRYRYMVKELDKVESLKLFTCHAFGNAKPNDTFMELSEDILHHASGLPLAIEVFGSSLYKRSEVGWKSFIEKLQRIPNSTIQQRLIISLDALELDDPMLMKLFLDIACLFIGYDKKWVVKRMESYYYYTAHNIDILKKRCMLTINDHDQLEMHDLLRDMGREVGRNNCPDEPEKHSRLYVSEDICNVLKKYKGTEAIEVIYLSKSKSQPDALKGTSLAVVTFKCMSKLRFLYLDIAVNITGSFEQIFEDLRWLYWKYCPLKSLPSNFCPQKLVILEFPQSKMRTLWEPHVVPQVFEKLKTLNMSYSLDLSITPDFTKLPCLESLDFEGCESLEELHISIGSLVSLVLLNLRDCVKLRSLQDSICNLRRLEILIIDGCTDLEALPIKMGSIKSLKELDARDLTILKLPNSIGYLRKLVVLNLSRNSELETLPDTICNMRSLEIVDISYCRKLEKLPDQLWKITGLREVDVRYATKLKTLPDIESSQIVLSMQKLGLSFTGLTTLPSGFSQFSKLESLEVRGCHHLLSITELPPNLKFIAAHNCTSLQTLPDLSNLKQLEYIDLINCRCLTKILGLEELTSIKRLCLSDCNSSLLAHTLSARLLQIHSQFGHEIEINIGNAEFPEWISKACGLGGSTLVLDLPPNVLHNSLFLGIILCCNFDNYHNSYNIKNTAKDVIWTCDFVSSFGAMMVIVPRSKLLLTDEDRTIELTVKGGSTDGVKIHAIHLLYND